MLSTLDHLSFKQLCVFSSFLTLLNPFYFLHQISDKHNTHIIFSLIRSQNKTNDTTNKRKRKGDSLRAKLSKKGRTVILDTKNNLNKLQIVEATKARTSMLDYIKTKYKSLQKRLQKIYKLQLNSFVIVAIQAALSHKLINVKSFSSIDAIKKVNILHRIRYKNFNAFLECFIFEDCCYVVLEHTTISLAYIVKSPAYLIQH